MEMQTYGHGVPSWVDVGTDVDKAKDFYRALFGWDIPDGPPEAGGYSIAFLRGKTVAGVGPQMNPGPPVWSAYVNVDDADAIAEKVTANGGQVVLAPMDVMTAGRMAFFADPAGAVFGIWQAGDHKGAQLVNEPGTFGWSELVTTDMEGAKAFYHAVFGWGAETHGDYTEWKLGDRSIGGGMPKPAEMPAEVPPYWGVYFVVEDTDATVAKVNELGGSLIFGPVDIEPGRFATVADSTGAMFNVLAMKAG
ncbi:MAG TPA: VOC family protein [Acidimicrobiales bacterium]|nr:VOC family protein [Acidimicrobiales bacterium]